MDLVYHLAGIAHLWTRHRDGFDLANRQGTETVMRVAKELSVSRVVHCSTELILLPKRRPGAPPIQEHFPLTIEDMPGPYTRSKFLAEAAAVQAAQDGLDVTIVNPTVPVGAGDHNMTPPAAMLALFLQGGSSFLSRLRAEPRRRPRCGSGHPARGRQRPHRRALHPRRRECRTARSAAASGASVGPSHAEAARLRLRWPSPRVSSMN